MPNAPCEMPSPVASGAAAAILIGCPGQLLELPIEAWEPRHTGDKNDATGSHSRDANGRVWKSQSGGALAMGLSIRGKYFPNAQTIPPLIKRGAYYYIEAYYRRPGTGKTGIPPASDPGYGHSGIFYIDSNTIPVNVVTGEISYTIEASSDGPVSDIGVP